MINTMNKILHKKGISKVQYPENSQKVGDKESQPSNPNIQSPGGNRELNAQSVTQNTTDTRKEMLSVLTEIEQVHLQHPQRHNPPHGANLGLVSNTS